MWQALDADIVRMIPLPQSALTSPRCRIRTPPCRKNALVSVASGHLLCQGDRLLGTRKTDRSTGVLDLYS